MDDRIRALARDAGNGDRYAAEKLLAELSRNPEDPEEKFAELLESMIRFLAGWKAGSISEVLHGATLAFSRLRGIEIPAWLRESGAVLDPDLLATVARQAQQVFARPSGPGPRAVPFPGFNPFPNASDFVPPTYSSGDYDQGGDDGPPIPGPWEPYGRAPLDPNYSREQGTGAPPPGTTGSQTGDPPINATENQTGGGPIMGEPANPDLFESLNRDISERG